jgi:NADPH2:quinone reductase
VTYGTALHALKDRARMKPGETLVVLGAAGGAGLAAVEIGRLMGARVIACASSADKLAVAREAGAHETIDYSATDLREALKALAGPRGVDVVYDPVGGDLAEPALRSLGWKGRYLVVGFAGGDIPRIPLNLILLKGCDVMGVFWGAFIEKEPQIHRANVAAIFDWAAKGDLSARVHGVYPMEEIAGALGVIARREATGKLVIRP